ncbi:PrsW family intramembrane metalloprotease [Candidatus Peregrinibacteria bacterium]|jgi:protease PrsW|nr:PrsW family intramembrane metalloprotease [Candidatus Peregrinibacteria bacterium]MBT4632378.1 PrsW family intramembrane metalloprotease [Candidatus Peregrinibacteria bacterium]MBT5274956.1 PrsW family intramembrane metalloprotease [Candidatus Woesearchaeota archaeon]MBT5517015.1 PrsW family intramembrane metalloprotease [Candidatus Peregrinibacteria bacterium]MBT5823582.1 PrsW family intramembrane metalloprotease [Candidatus Peregrinibacteria bacterium]
MMDTLSPTYNVLISLGIATLPVAIVIWYFWHRDKGEKEPFKLMRKAFLFGILVTLPVGVAEVFFELFVKHRLPFLDVYLIIMPFLIIALPEEGAKLWVVLNSTYKNVKFNEIMDGITYAVLASMGFAVFENILYTLNYGIEVGILRGFTAIPAHALFSGIMGFYIGMAKFEKNKKKEKKLIRRGLMAAVFFHGLYDLLLFTNVTLLMYMIFPLIGYMAFILNRSIQKANAGIKEEPQYF